MMKAKLLVVDDEPLVLELMISTFPESRYELFCANCGEEALDILDRQNVDLAILDYSLPDMCGADLFRHVRGRNPELSVMFLTGHPNLETAVVLLKEGARDYMTKPFNITELRSRVAEILEQGNDRTREGQGVKPAGVGPPDEYLWGASLAMKAVEAQVQNLPRYPDTTVLISGPTGTGKTVVARRIHELTNGNRAPFVEIDCSTIPRELCESELFGHERGAFTGAHRSKPGLFEAASDGTAFLDEIGELDSNLQAKFLRVLEARCFQRRGHTVLPMRARIIAATNRSLPDLVRTGRFREDLFFRLNVIELWMPALRERGEDIIVLAQHFLRCFSARHGRPPITLAPDALDYLRNCDFPGNVRQLRNMIERAIITSDGTVIHYEKLIALGRDQRPAFSEVTEESMCPSRSLAGPVVGPSPDGTATLNLAEIEKQKLREALTAASGNKSKAAKMVGLSRTAFYRRLQKRESEAGPSNIDS